MNVDKIVLNAHQKLIEKYGNIKIKGWTVKKYYQTLKKEMFLIIKGE